MALCPNCKRHFREPADEVGDHDCPRCGYTREEAAREEDDDT